jgi:hypothetical protein
MKAVLPPEMLRRPEARRGLIFTVIARKCNAGLCTKNGRRRAIHKKEQARVQQTP